MMGVSQKLGRKGKGRAKTNSPRLLKTLVIARAVEMSRQNRKKKREKRKIREILWR
jgi:hypothetical protein